MDSTGEKPLFKRNDLFQFWEYSITHGSLLIRGSTSGDYLLFSGVVFLELPHEFDTLEVRNSLNNFTNHSVLTAQGMGIRVATFELQSKHQVGRIVAESLKHCIAESSDRLGIVDIWKLKPIQIFHSS